MSDNQRPVAYAGDKPYIFVSYCHADSDDVFPFILALQERYNVWFDEGIHYGRKWDEEIARRLKSCAGVLFMVTEKSLAPEVCEKELKFAQRKDKDIINIFMDNNLILSEWFDFHFGDYRYCKLPDFSDRNDAVADLTRNSRWLKGIAKPEPKPESKVAYPPPEKPSEPMTKAPSAIQRVRETPEEIIERLKGKLEFEKLADGTYKIVKGSSELQTVQIPFFVSVIGEDAFKGAKLKSIDIPDSVTLIGDMAFAGCESLNSVTLGRGLKRISRKMFRGCHNLRSIKIPEGVTKIEWGAFDYSGLTEITLPTTLKTVVVFAFDVTGLQRVNYCGTREQWKEIAIGDFNDKLRNAEIIYNYTAP